jgi:hypothetical protein
MSIRRKVYEVYEFRLHTRQKKEEAEFKIMH